MQHPLDQPSENLCADLIHRVEGSERLEEACAEARLAWDSDLTRPRGDRVAWTLSHLLSDEESLIAACLADPRLRANYKPGEMGKHYGEAVARMVGELHRLNTFGETRMALHDAQQAENMRRLLLAMVSDVRVILIKLVYRLERLRHLPKIDDPAQRRLLAAETLTLFTPLAHRLGLGQIKWEMEDLAFRHLEPATYKRIAALLDERRVERESYIQRVRDQLEQALRAEGIEAKVYGRPKHIYSIFDKMRRKRLGFEQLFDVRALRVQVESIEQCYGALSVVQHIWQPIPGEYDDYIAHPKANGYQSLHTAVRALDGKTLEVQIRTREMHERAELGVAAHWRYKEGGKSRGDDLAQELDRLRIALEEGESTTLDAQCIYVFTPKGQLVELPRGATPLDLAYSLHTELGHQCKGAKVNGRMVPLNTPLNNTDRVELLRSPQGTPSREWADAKSGYLVSKSARQRVRAWFRQREREHARDAGRAQWDKTVRRLGLSREQREVLIQRLKQKSEIATWEAIGEGKISPAALLDAARACITAPQDMKTATPLPGSRILPQRLTRGIDLHGLQAEPARCCNPMPGDVIVGFITRGQGLRLHRSDCRNIQRLRQTQPERLMEVDWPYLEGMAVRVELRLLADDHSSLLGDISHVLAQHKARVNAIDTQRERISSQLLMRIKLELPDMTSLHPLMDRLHQLDGVDDVQRA